MAKGDERLSTGRAKRPADSVPGHGPVPRSAERLGVKLGHALGERLDRAVRHRHRDELRHAGWEHALDESTAAFVRGGADPRPGNALEVLIDGAEALPRIAEELARAQSHVHLTGWFLSPELQLTREEEPVVVRNLLAELAERIDVRVLLWEGAPVPAFRPSRGDVRRVRESLVRHTRIRSAVDGRTGLTHCHHEKTIVIDDRVAFVGGIDLTLDGGDPFDTGRTAPAAGIGWHDAAARIEGPAVVDVAEHFRLRWRGPRPARSCRRPTSPSRQATSSSRSRARCPRRRIARRGAATTRSSRPTWARCAPPSGSSTSRTSSSGRPRSSGC